MLLSEFSFELPESLIAKHPVSPRDSARLLAHDRASGTVEDRSFLDLPDREPGGERPAAGRCGLRARHCP